MGRHELREQVFKLLFRVGFYDAQDMPEQIQLFLADEENKIDEKSALYIEERFRLIQDRLTQIDQVINRYMEKWDTGRIGTVELAVLRLAVYEMLYDPDIPDAVAINEAVEIAKEYGQENSGSFVNAVLSKIEKRNEKE